MSSPEFSTATLVGWATAATVVVLLAVFPPARLENFPSICLYQQIYDVSCLGCGMSRAAASLLRGDFAGAWEYNWRIFVVGPILAYVGIRPLLTRFFGGQSRSP